MNEKRFTVPVKYSLSHSKIQCDGEPLTNDELVRILNTNDGAFLENFYLKKENEQLKKELFEARKDYLIETADISDKLYLEDMIEEERKEIFGDNDD